MKRSIFLVIAIVAAAAATLVSCDAMFTNYFESTGLATQPPIESLPRQTALVLSIEQDLAATGADKVVDGIVAYLLHEGEAMDPESGEFWLGFAEGLLPPEALDDPAAFAALVDSLRGLQDKLDELAGTIDGDGGYGDGGIDPMEIAVAALLCTVLNRVTPAAPGAETVGEACAAAYADYLAGTGNPPSHYLGGLDGDIFAGLESDPTLTALLAPAGLDLTILSSGT